MLFTLFWSQFAWGMEKMMNTDADDNDTVGDIQRLEPS